MQFSKQRRLAWLGIWTRPSGFLQNYSNRTSAPRALSPYSDFSEAGSSALNFQTASAQVRWVLWRCICAYALYASYTLQFWFIALFPGLLSSIFHFHSFLWTPMQEVMSALRSIRSELSILKSAVTSDTAGLKSEVAKITGLILKRWSSMQKVFF